MKRKTPTLKTCRICRAATGPENPDYPFCSPACRERDLGNWATESYRVAASIPNEDELADIASALSQLDEDER